MARQVVCVVGAGAAGLEALLSAREELGPEIDLRLIAPEREFRYRPMSAGSLFRPARERGLAIGDVVGEIGAKWLADRVEVVHDAERSLLTRDGDTERFDFLLLAVGARSRRTLRQGYVWERGGDPGFLDRILAEIVADEVRSVAVVVPRGARWPLPACELALVLAWRAAGTDTRVVLITAEGAPLDALGPEASDAVVRELDAAGVEVISGVEVTEDASSNAKSAGPVRVILVPEDPAGRTDALTGKPATIDVDRDLADQQIGSRIDPARMRPGAGSSAEYDRLISLPSVDGPSIAGVASDAVGFVEVDEGLRVCGSERVWAAGGCIAAALEHSALAARQADAAVAAIAAAMNIATEQPVAPMLTGMLLTGQRDQWLAENPIGTREPSTRCLWWPPGRAVGRMLAKRIAAWDPSVRSALPSQPQGLMIRAPVAIGSSERSLMRAGAEVTTEVRNARLRDIENRQVMAVQRRERAADTGLQELRAELQALTARQQDVVHELQQHGYLHDHQ